MIDMKRNIVHYLVLIILLGMSTWMFKIFQGYQGFQLAIGVITSCLYIVWGIVHHSIVGDLHRKVVIEYILIGTIAIALCMIVLRS